MVDKSILLIRYFLNYPRDELVALHYSNFGINSKNLNILEEIENVIYGNYNSVNDIVLCSISKVTFE